MVGSCSSKIKDARNCGMYVLYEWKNEDVLFSMCCLMLALMVSFSQLCKLPQEQNVDS